MISKVKRKAKGEPHLLISNRYLIKAIVKQV
nr:MAG TPA: hypothetical protein [Caudoviricetes sp.]